MVYVRYDPTHAAFGPSVGEIRAGAAPDQRRLCHGRPGPHVQTPALPSGLLPL